MQNPSLSPVENAHAAQTEPFITDEPTGGQTHEAGGTTPREIWQGRPYPLGATWTGAGVNFALFSENATGVILCLFDDVGPLERAGA